MMRPRFRSPFRHGVPFLAIALLAPAALAQPPASPGPAISQGIDDPAFARYVDLSLLADAWEDKNAEMLTDMALQLAEGERILLRSHKGIAADQVFAAALRVATERGDKESLIRLEKALGQQQKTALLAEARRATQLASASRAVDPGLVMQVEKTTSLAFFVMQDTLEAISSSKLGQNPKAIEAIIVEIPKMSELTEPQRKALLKLAKEAQAALPKDASEVDSTVVALNKLLDESREPNGNNGGKSQSHPSGSHPSGNHPTGNRPVGNRPVVNTTRPSTTIRNTTVNRPVGNRTAYRPSFSNVPRLNYNYQRYVAIQRHWQRRFYPRYNGYIYYDPGISRYYYFDQGTSSYAVLDDNVDDDGSSDSDGN